jgi:calcineurin-like phosphoesterase family protein
LKEVDELSETLRGERWFGSTGKMMSVVRFIGCTHFGHKRYGYKTMVLKMNLNEEFFIKQWNSVVNKKDTTYLLW